MHFSKGPDGNGGCVLQVSTQSTTNWRQMYDWVLWLLLHKNCMAYLVEMIKTIEHDYERRTALATIYSLFSLSRAGMSCNSFISARHTSLPPKGWSRSCEECVSSSSVVTFYYIVGSIGYTAKEKGMLVLDIFSLVANKRDYRVIQAICGKQLAFRHDAQTVVIDYKQRLKRKEARREVKMVRLWTKCVESGNTFELAHRSCCYSCGSDVRTMKPKYKCGRCLIVYYCNERCRQEREKTHARVCKVPPKAW